MSATTVILPLKSPSTRMLVKHRNRAAWREPCDRELNTDNLAKSMLVPLRPAVLTQRDCSIRLLPWHTTLPLIGTPRHRIGLKSCQDGVPPRPHPCCPTRDQGGGQSLLVHSGWNRALQALAQKGRLCVGLAIVNLVGEAWSQQSGGDAWRCAPGQRAGTDSQTHAGS